MWNELEVNNNMFETFKDMGWQRSYQSYKGLYHLSFLGVSNYNMLRTSPHTILVGLFMYIQYVIAVFENYCSFNVCIKWALPVSVTPCVRHHLHMLQVSPDEQFYLILNLDE